MIILINISRDILLLLLFKDTLFNKSKKFNLKKILVISDTHSYVDNKIINYVKQADQVWHAGDLGKIEVLEKIENICKTIAVYGNIDNQLIRGELKEYEIFYCEGVKVLMIHIAGKPPIYNQKTNSLIRNERPKILVYGHSHILKVRFDKKNEVLLINPGAAGRHGFHKKRTMIRFEIDGNSIKNMEIIELGQRSKLPDSI